eukprot:851442_1
MESFYGAVSFDEAKSTCAKYGLSLPWASRHTRVCSEYKQTWIDLGKLANKKTLSGLPHACMPPGLNKELNFLNKSPSVHIQQKIDKHGEWSWTWKGQAEKSKFSCVKDFLADVKDRSSHTFFIAFSCIYLG